MSSAKADMMDSRALNTHLILRNMPGGFKSALNALRDANQGRMALHADVD